MAMKLIWCVRPLPSFLCSPQMGQFFQSVKCSSLVKAIIVTWWILKHERPLGGLRNRLAGSPRCLQNNAWITRPPKLCHQKFSCPLGGTLQVPSHANFTSPVDRFMYQKKDSFAKRNKLGHIKECKTYFPIMKIDALEKPPKYPYTLVSNWISKAAKSKSQIT